MGEPERQPAKPPKLIRTVRIPPDSAPEADSGKHPLSSPPVVPLKRTKRVHFGAHRIPNPRERFMPSEDFLIYLAFSLHIARKEVTTFISEALGADLYLLRPPERYIERFKFVYNRPDLEARTVREAGCGVADLNARRDVYTLTKLKRDMARAFRSEHGTLMNSYADFASRLAAAPHIVYDKKYELYAKCVECLGKVGDTCIVIEEPPALQAVPDLLGKYIPSMNSFGDRKAGLKTAMSEHRERTEAAETDEKRQRYELRHFFYKLRADSIGYKLALRAHVFS